MRKKLEIEVKVGLFVSLGLGLVLLAILILGSTENLTSRKSDYFAHFDTVDGLIQGAKITVGGIAVGTVTSMEFDEEHRNIRVYFTVARSASQWIRKDSTVELATQGVLGDKFLSINPGTSEQPELPPNSEIPNRPTKDFSQFLSKGDQLMISLNGIATSVDRLLKTFESGNRSEIFFQGMAASAKNLSQLTEKFNHQMEGMRFKDAVNNLDGILSKMNNGTGTLGALINDPTLYDDAKALVGQTNRNRILRNYVRQAIKQSEQEEAPAGTAPAPASAPSGK